MSGESDPFIPSLHRACITVQQCRHSDLGAAHPLHMRAFCPATTMRTQCAHPNGWVHSAGECMVYAGFVLLLLRQVARGLQVA